MKRKTEYQKLQMKAWYQKNKQKKIEYQKKYREDNPDYVIKDRERSKQYQTEARKDPVFRDSKRVYDLKHKYNLSKKQYTQLLKDQNYMCAICFEPETPKKRLHVDHSHITNDVRGLLCHMCNKVLGMVLDSPILLGRMLGYLASTDHNPKRTTKYLKSITNHAKKIGRGKKIIDREMIKTTNEFLTTLNDELTKVYIKEKESKGTLEEFM
tara:strand:+ start:154 stop:786 length:633 start_codon:yes stop_codon:yes gene_type:complete